MSRYSTRCRTLIAALLVWAGGAGSAWAIDDPNAVSFTLEGCRNDGSIVLPDSGGKFICPSGAYTTGNLGKGWNELDLVPYRLTAKAGNAAPTSQTYAVQVVVDNKDEGRPGYDVLSTLTLNAALSSGSCSAALVGSESVKVPGIGGIDESRARLVTITQGKNSTCVYDYYARLALGSHLFPGSSLHANLTNQTFGTAGVGARDVSIPVKEISPQELRKDMAATGDSSYQWNLTKVATPATVNFGDVCKADAPFSQPVSVRVEWTRSEAVPGKVTITTNVYAKNPAARTITVNVTDVIYKGTTQATVLDTASSGPVDIAANTEKKVMTHSVTLDPAMAGSVGDFVNDVATASYIDKVTGIPVPGTTTAVASAVIGTGSVLDASASIADLEKIDLANPNNTGLSFAVAAPTIGSFIDYTAGNKANEVKWGVIGQTGSGFVEFSKTIYLDAKRILTNGEMTDVATLVTSDQAFAKTAGPIYVTVLSSASVKLTLSKSIPVILAAGERIEVTFNVTRANDPTYQATKTLTFTGGGPLNLSTELTGLVPDAYTVTEVSSLFFADASSPGVDAKLAPVGGPQRTVDLSATNGVVTNCAGAAEFVNRIPQDLYPKAQVKKLTFPTLEASDPDYTWTFTLSGPGIPGGSISTTAGAGAGYVDFGIDLQEEGVYTVTETQKSPTWKLTSADPDPTAGKVCTFAVNFPQDIGATFSCTFTNTKQGLARVLKTVLGQAPSGTQAFTFQLRQGATTTNAGTTLETEVANAANGGVLNFDTLLVPGQTYQLCEIVMPGWLTSLGTFVPDSFMPPDGVATNPNVDNSILCGNFAVEPGQTKAFAVDNSPPPGGRALTIGFWKNWASCKKSGGKQAPVLDRTMAAAQPTGIQVDGFSLHGSTATPDAAPDCGKAVNLLSKQDFTGKNRASDPLFNMAAQLVAAELNYAAGAAMCGPVTIAIGQANALLTTYGFTGLGYAGPLSSSDATLANKLAKTLDDYNNNRASACL